MADLDPVFIATCLRTGTPLSDETVRAVVEEWLKFVAAAKSVPRDLDWALEPEEVSL